MPTKALTIDVQNTGEFAAIQPAVQRAAKRELQRHRRHRWWRALLIWQVRPHKIESYRVIVTLPPRQPLLPELDFEQIRALSAYGVAQRKTRKLEPIQQTDALQLEDLWKQ